TVFRARTSCNRTTKRLRLIRRAARLRSSLFRAIAERTRSTIGTPMARGTTWAPSTRGFKTQRRRTHEQQTQEAHADDEGIAGGNAAAAGEVVPQRLCQAAGRRKLSVCGEGAGGHPADH